MEFTQRISFEVASRVGPGEVTQLRGLDLDFALLRIPFGSKLAYGHRLHLSPFPIGQSNEGPIGAHHQLFRLRRRFGRVGH